MNSMKKSSSSIFHIQMLNKEMKKVGRILETITLLKEDVITDNIHRKLFTSQSFKYVTVAERKELCKRLKLDIAEKILSDDLTSKLLKEINTNPGNYEKDENERIEDIMKEAAVAESEDNTFTFDLI